MNKDHVEGKVKDIAGRAEREVGEWTGDSKSQVKGAAKQGEGKVQNAWGKAKDAVDKSNDCAKASERRDEPLDADDEESTPRRRAS